MRFANVKTSLPAHRAPAAEFLRRLLQAQPRTADTEPDPISPADLPLDLDQRVRLVGEW